MERLDIVYSVFALVIPVLSLLAVTTTTSLAQSSPPPPLDSQASLPPPTVEVKQGKIQGIWATYKKTGEKYQAFRGIPYAQAPIGQLRFAKPLPHPGFSGVFRAEDYGPICVQDRANVRANMSMSEDCLTLNVFVPEISRMGDGTSSKDNPTYPVLVYIHGGAFVGSTARIFEMANLVTEGDVILVTLQYRLGILGFLSTGDSVLPGNYGLWDQVLALGWIKENIAAFGGNPNAVTVSGQSAGAASVSYLTLSPHSQRLFQKALLQSGTATSSWAFTSTPRRSCSAFAQRVGCRMPPSERFSSAEDQLKKRRKKQEEKKREEKKEEEKEEEEEEEEKKEKEEKKEEEEEEEKEEGEKEEEEFLDCLRALPAEDFMNNEVSNRSIGWKVTGGEIIPCVDGEFIADTPHNLLYDSQYLEKVGFYDIDYLTGVTNNEGGVIYQMATSFGYDEKALLTDPDFFDNDLLKVLLEQRFMDSNPSLQDIASFYYTAPRLYNHTTLNLDDVLLMEGDVAFYVPCVENARAVARKKRPDKRNLVYYFNYYPEFMTGDVKGIPHTMDVAYEKDTMRFLIPVYKGDPSFWDSDDELMGQYFRSIILDFVKYSDPTRTLGSQVSGKWIDFDLADESYLSLSPHNSTVLRHPFARRVALWTELLPKFKVTPVKVEE